MKQDEGVTQPGAQLVGLGGGHNWCGHPGQKMDSKINTLNKKK